MKRWILPTFFVWTLIGAVAIAAYSEHPDAPAQVVEGKGSIAWQDSFEGAMKTALAEKKPALVVFESDDCAYCKQMDKTTWRDARVQAQAHDWVTVKVNGTQRQDLMAAYGIQGYPTSVLVSGTGKPFAGREGYIEPGEFVSFLQDSRKKWKS